MSGRCRGRLEVKLETLTAWASPLPEAAVREWAETWLVRAPVEAGKMA